MIETRPFAERLLTWFDQHGRHDLPWQHPRTPYRVWISEIMLQQTQVQTVIPYFERFIKRFPNLPALAESPRDDVMAHWAGLGYYARARNLHKAAIVCMAKHKGELPPSAEDLGKLPGIGESTANAIWSQSWDRPAAVLDGNVRRVLARHDGIEGWPGDKAVLESMWRAARKRLPKDRGADYTQAIMDLGATVCVRGKPRCDRCPTSSDCVALRDGRTVELPSRKPRTSVREVTLDMLVALDPAGRVLLEKRPPKGIWGGLWSLPEGNDATSLCEALGVGPSEAQAGPTLQHRLTHRLLHIKPTRVQILFKPGKLKYRRETGWFGRDQWPGLGLPRPVANLLENLDGETET